MNETNMKVCTKCRGEYPHTSDFFYKDESVKSGLASQCKKCVIAGVRKWQAENPEQRKKNSREYTRRNAQHYRDNAHRWQRENPETASRLKQLAGKRRRERIRNSIVSLTDDQWRAILQTFNYCCAYCGQSESEAGLLQHDHVIPVAQGGDFTAANIVPACQSCNSKKHARTPEQAGMEIRRYGGS